MYATLADVTEVLPDSITVGDTNIGTPSPGSQANRDQLTAEQKQAHERLEQLLALIEGWVSMVVTDAINNRLASATSLDETFRRRRASGGPAEKLFAGLIGLELRPKRMREATDLWRNLTELKGQVERDDIWQHPDLLPSIDDLADVDGYLSSQSIDLMTELNRIIETTEAPKED